MALLAATIKNCLLALALLAATAAPVAAATFSMKRGINLDIWVTWPDEKLMGRRGGDPALPRMAQERR